MRNLHEDVKLEPGQITVSEYQMRVGGFDDGNEDPYGDPAGEPESDPTPFLMAPPSGPEFFLLLERMSTSELKQRLDEQFGFRIWLALRKRQWKSQRCERRIAQHSARKRIRVEQKKEQEAKEAELRRIRRIETDRAKDLMREEATPSQSTVCTVVNSRADPLIWP